MLRKLSITDKFYLLIPIYADDDEEVIYGYVHSAPISREIFEANYMLLGRTFAAIYTSKLSVISGPRMASYLLASEAKEMGDPVAAIALMNEIRRLTNVMVRTDTGTWEALPFQEVHDRGLLGDDLEEVTNAIVFFIVASATLRRTERKKMVDGAMKIWGALTSPLDFMEFAASLTTSTLGDARPIIPGSSEIY